jgi:SMC interacting uncharacterized protein involved in chromosome segregation
MTTEQRYVVKLASGAWLTELGTQTRALREAQKGSRADAYRVAASWSAYGAVALRLKPSARAAELARLEAENDELLESLRKRDNDVAKLRAEVEELRNALREMGETSKQFVKVCAERDALAAKLASLPPDVTDEQVADTIFRAGGGVAERACERLDNMAAWNALGARARELGAR